MNKQQQQQKKVSTFGFYFLISTEFRLFFKKVLRKEEDKIDSGNDSG